MQTWSKSEKMWGMVQPRKGIASMTPGGSNYIYHFIAIRGSNYIYHFIAIRGSNYIYHFIAV